MDFRQMCLRTLWFSVLVSPIYFCFFLDILHPPQDLQVKDLLATLIDYKERLDQTLQDKEEAMGHLTDMKKMLLNHEQELEKTRSENKRHSEIQVKKLAAQDKEVNRLHQQLDECTSESKQQHYSFSQREAECASEKTSLLLEIKKMKAALLNQTHEYQRAEKIFQDRIEVYREKQDMMEKDSSEQAVRLREVQSAFEEERAMFEKQINLLQDELNRHDKNRSPKQKLNIMLLGQRERTKHLVANTILDREEFDSCLAEKKEASVEVEDRVISIVNMPKVDMLDVDATRNSFADAILLHPEGYHAFVLVFSLTERPSFLELKALTAFGTVFGKDVYKYIIFLFTHDVRDESVKTYFSRIKGSMGEYIAKAEQRYLMFNVNGNSHRKKELTGQLYKLIDNMMQKQNGKLYSNYMFEKAKIYVNTNSAIQTSNFISYHHWFMEENRKHGFCFPSSGLVQSRRRGRIPISDVVVGEAILASSPDGKTFFDSVYLLSHQDNHTVTEFMKISTFMHTILISPGHHILADLCTTVPAGSVQLGDTILVHSGNGSVSRQEVIHIESVLEKGLFAPVTLGGNMVIDDVLVSCYTDTFNPGWAHTLLGPVRLLYRYVPSLVSLLSYQSPSGRPAWLENAWKVWNLSFFV